MNEPRSGYYQGKARQALFISVAQSWRGTPFVPHAQLRGAGVDCVNLCAAVYIATGFLSSFAAPKYTMDGGKHNRESQLENWIAASGRFEALPSSIIHHPSSFLPGDLLTFKIGRSAHHTGMILAGPHFIHCLFGRQVTTGTLIDGTFLRILHAAHRPLELPAGSASDEVPR